MESQRQELLQQVEYWTSIVDTYQNYRDGYIKLALLEYQLGNTVQARVYVQKALVLDPNYKKGRELEKIVGK